MPGTAGVESDDTMQSIKILQDEKAKLLREIERIESEIVKQDENHHSEHSGNGDGNGKRNIIILKSGYLFKWQDRQIGWGGTKWDLRFVKLDKGRLGYFKNHYDSAPRYLLTLNNCAVRDDGCKLNKRFRPKKENKNEVKESTPGAFFHVFSLYQRPKEGRSSDADLDEDDNIVPLLRFSTTSLAEKVQWMDLLIQSCAYCDSDDFDRNETSSSSFIAQNDGSIYTPYTKGTLPPVYFASSAHKIERNPSHCRLTKLPSHLKLNLHKDSARSNSKKKNHYPPSKPMHRRAEGSYLSHDSPAPNYRGLVNLGIIILVISNFRILLATMRQYGSVLTHGFFFTSEGEYSFQWKNNTVDVPFFFGMVILNMFVVFAFFIELATSQKVFREWLGISLHVINTNLALLLPMVIVWKYINSPINGAVLQMTSTILWMKLISYAHANADYRHFPDRDVETIIQNTDEDSTALSYPRNITITNIYYFWFAPTLTYQMIFPRLVKRSMGQILNLIFRLFLCFVLLAFLVAQVFRPTLNNMLEELNELEGEDIHILSVNIFAEYLLKLGIASSYIWLLIFYGFFHVLLNLLAQLLRFGDRVFYRDWWNSTNLSSYWRLWNLPVHYWLVRHLYHPCIRRGISKSIAMLIVFFFFGCCT